MSIQAAWNSALDSARSFARTGLLVKGAQELTGVGKEPSTPVDVDVTKLTGEELSDVVGNGQDKLGKAALGQIDATEDRLVGYGVDKEKAKLITDELRKGDNTKGWSDRAFKAIVEARRAQRSAQLSAQAADMAPKNNSAGIIASLDEEIVHPSRLEDFK